MQLITSGLFNISIDRDKQLLIYTFYDGAICHLPVNDSDIKHGNNLRLTGLSHKILHELTHHYVAEALGYNVCPIVYAQAHNFAMPTDAAYLEEIVFSTVYFIRESNMLYANWWGYLDRLHGKGFYTIVDKINTAFNYVRCFESVRL